MKSESEIRHADVYGTRKHKYETLRASDLNSIDWQILSPNTPFYLFRPQEQELREEYEQGWRITNVFPVNVLGFQTHRDPLTVAFNSSDLQRRIKAFYEIGEEEAREKYKLGSWDVGKAQNKLRSDADWEKPIAEVLYRPFDVRSCYYSSVLVDRPRTDLVQHVLRQKNVVLLASRQQAVEGFYHAFVTTLPANDCVMSTTTREANQAFPLWLYPKEGSLEEGEERRANLSPAFVQEVAERIGETPTPEAIFHYAYAVFHAPTYRTRYAPFLKIDFPRLPLPPDGNTFHALAALGEQLVALHLLEAPELTPTRIAYPAGGDHIVEKRNAAKRYLPPTSEGAPGRVTLNATEYFDNVPPTAWEFRVGGYQPAFKWLDDRAGRALTEADITHYRKMLAALRETAALLPAVDAAFVRTLGMET